MVQKQTNQKDSENSLYYPNIREFMYSFLLSYRHVVSDPSKRCSFKKIGMKSGNSFTTFFNSHSRISQTKTLVKYPAYGAHLLFEYMSPNSIFATLQSLLLGRSVVLVADCPAILTDVAFGLLQLLEPL